MDVSKVMKKVEKLIGLEGLEDSGEYMQLGIDESITNEEIVRTLEEQDVEFVDSLVFIGEEDTMYGVILELDSEDDIIEIVEIDPEGEGTEVLYTSDKFK